MIVPDRLGDNSRNVIPVRVWHTENRQIMFLVMYCNNATDVIRVPVEQLTHRVHLYYACT